MGNQQKIIKITKNIENRTESPEINSNTVIFDKDTKRTQREKTVSSVHDAEKNGLLHTKEYQKWVKDLNISPETIKLLQNNITEKLQDTGLGHGFLGYHTRSSGHKNKSK